MMMTWFYWMTELPGGEYWRILDGDRESGFAFARDRGDGVELGLFLSPHLQEMTGTLVALLAAKLESPIRYLTVTREHADALEGQAGLRVDRDRGSEWVFVFRPVDLGRWEDGDGDGL